jgi:PAS domain S-box-containing protein
MKFVAVPVLTRTVGCVLFSPQAPSPAVTASFGVGPAMEVTLSRKLAKSRTRGRKLHLTRAKARVGRTRQSRADLEQQLKACRREIAYARERLVEAMKQQNASSEMLRIISNSPIQSVLDTVAENAARLCDSNNAEIFRLENNLLRLVASCGEIPVNIHAREGLAANRDRVMGRAACDRRTIHVHDLAAEDSEYSEGSRDAKREGHHTTLATPLLREGTPIGVILIRRWEIRPFNNKQIALLETFADQAVTTIENVRLFEAEKQRAEALRRSEAHLREAQWLSHTGSGIYNATTILYWSEELYRIWGFDPLQGVPNREALWQRIHPDDRDRAREEVEHALREKRSYSLEYRIVLPDGTVKHLQTMSHPAFSASGELVEITVTQIDLTERKRAEQAAEQVASIVESSDDAIVSKDLDGVIRTWNRGAERLFGYRAAEVIGRPITILIPPDRLDEEPGILARIRRGEPVDHYETVTVSPTRDAKGAIVGASKIARDITERKRAEQALRESEGKFRDYAETASDWFWETGPDHKFTQLTENAFGSDQAARIGTARSDHALDLETEPEKWRLLNATLDSRKPFRDFIYCCVGGNGSPMYVKASGKPVFDTNGEFRGYRGTGTDVTTLMRAQEEHERLRRLESDLAHMNRLTMMGELAASLAHEITQPIATARNNARAAMRFLDRNPPDLGEVREALACIVDDADRAGDIIDRIRDHIKKAPPRKGSFDLNKAINEVIALAESAITTNGVSVRTRLAEALVPVQGDRVQLQQVALNLILNAVEAMSTVEAGPRELLISTEQPQTGGVLVSVRDSGPGIDPDHVDRVFEAFYTTKSSGVGMGLSICRSIIDAHGGRLWADMNASRGAVFRFTLPGADTELTTSLRPAPLTREPHEDTLSDAAHRPAYEGNKRPRRSGRGRGQRRRGRQ